MKQIDNITKAINEVRKRTYTDDVAVLVPFKNYMTIMKHLVVDNEGKDRFRGYRVYTMPDKYFPPEVEFYVAAEEHIKSITEDIERNLRQKDFLERSLYEEIERYSKEMSE